jgi:cell division protein FtsL
MIQPQVEYQTVPRTSHVRVREATRRRTSRARRRGFIGLVRVASVCMVVVMCVLGYVYATARIASLDDRLARATTERTALVEETARLDDTIAALTSHERLAAIAQKLGMRESRTYASVALPVPPRADGPRGIAFLGNWFAK